MYLLGESFGGVLALAVAAEYPAVVDRLVLVNPASCYPQSIWPSLGPLLPGLPPVRLLSCFSIQMLLVYADSDSPPIEPGFNATPDQSDPELDLLDSYTLHASRLKCS